MSSRTVRTSLHQMQRLCRRGGLRSRQKLFPRRSSSSRISLSISSNLGAWTTCLTSPPLATRIVSFTDGVARFVSKMNGFTGAWPTSRATMRCCSTGPFKIVTTAWTSTSRRTPSSSLGLHQVAGDMFASLLGRVVLLTILRRSSTPPPRTPLPLFRPCGARDVRCQATPCVWVPLVMDITVLWLLLLDLRHLCRLRSWWLPLLHLRHLGRLRPQWLPLLDLRHPCRLVG